MKKHVCAAALALCFVLAACAPEPGASSASVPSSSAAASSLPPASGTAGQAAPPLDLPYEKIQPVADHATPYPYLPAALTAADLCITPCAEAACGA